MAAIDDKIAALNFKAVTFSTPEQVVALAHDAAAVAQGEKIVLTRPAPLRVDGTARSRIRATHAEFSVLLRPQPDGATTVELKVGDYLRTRDTLLSVVPVGPWSAPAYRTLRQFSEHLLAAL